MGINGVNAGYDYRNYYQNLQYQNQNQATSPMAINMSGVGATCPEYVGGTIQAAGAQGKDCTDGKDDGSIGFWSGLGHFLKGAVKFVTSPFTDENGNFSLGKTLKSIAIGVGIAALTSVPIIGPLVTPTLLAVGLGTGAYKAVKAGANIMTAKTDAEAKEAWESLGSSATQIAVSAYAAKKYASAQLGRTASVGEGIKQVFKEPIDAVKSGYNSAKTMTLGELTQKTGIDNVMNRIRPDAATASTGAEAGAGAAAESGAGTAASSTASKPLFANTRARISDFYEAHKGQTLGEMTRNAARSGKTWAYDHGFRNNISGNYRMPFYTAAYVQAADS